MKPAPKKSKLAKVLSATAAKLSIHPLLSSLPVTDAVVKKLGAENKKGGQYAEYAELHDEAAQSWQGFVEDISARGIMEPLICVMAGKDLKIIDGRHRFTAGLELGIAKFPYRLHTGDPAEYILGSVCQRYHWGKGTRAFFALELHQDLIENKQGTRADLEPSDEIGKFTRKELAVKIGVSVDLMEQAASLHRLMRGHKHLRSKFIHRVFAGQSLLGIERAMEMELTGHTDDDQNGGAKRLKAWEYFADRFKRDSKAWQGADKKWAQLAHAPAEWRERVFAQLKTFAAAIPHPVREMLVEQWKEAE